jgi:hypothetical protein
MTLLLYCFLVWLWMDRAISPVRMIVYMAVLLGIATINLYLLRAVEPDHEDDGKGAVCFYEECLS